MPVMRLFMARLFSAILQASFNSHDNHLPFNNLETFQVALIRKLPKKAKKSNQIT